MISLIRCRFAAYLFIVKTGVSPKLRLCLTLYLTLAAAANTYAHQLRFMPKKGSVYTRNKDFVDSLREQGKSWQEVADALTKIGEKCTKAGVHYAYKTWLEKQDRNSGLETEKTRPKDKVKVLKKAKDAATAAVSAGYLSRSEAEQFASWATTLEHYSSTMARDYLDVCRGQRYDRCLAEFSKRMDIARELASQPKWRKKRS